MCLWFDVADRRVGKAEAVAVHGSLGVIPVEEDQPSCLYADGRGLFHFEIDGCESAVLTAREVLTEEDAVRFQRQRRSPEAVVVGGAPHAFFVVVGDQGSIDGVRGAKGELGCGVVVTDDLDDLPHGLVTGRKTGTDDAVRQFYDLCFRGGHLCNL